MPRITAVLLAGTLKPTALRQAIDMPMVCLPMGGNGTLLHAWTRAISPLDGLVEIRVVVNSEADAETVRGIARGFPSRVRSVFDVRGEPASWRGAAGLIRDVTDNLGDDALVLAAEATCMPPQSLEPLLGNWRNGEAGVVGIAGRDQPAGVYLLTRQAIQRMPQRGYCDLKEQFLPRLAEAGLPVRAAQVGPRVLRVRDRESYLQAVAQSRTETGPSVASEASVSGSAVLDGMVLVDAGAVVEDGAVVHDSIVLAGATIGGGAVVSQCVVGPLATVSARSRLIRDVVVRRSGGEPEAARVGDRADSPRRRRVFDR